MEEEEGGESVVVVEDSVVVVSSGVMNSAVFDPVDDSESIEVVVSSRPFCFSFSA